MGDYQRLLVYRRALELSVRIHSFRFATRLVPGLSAQVRRACASIPSNIAEGCDRSPREFAARLRIAISESREAQHHLEFADSLGAIRFGDDKWAIAELVEVRKMMFGLMRHLERKQRINS